MKSGPFTMLAGFTLFGLAPVFVKLAQTYDWLVAHTLLARFGFALVAIIILGLWARTAGLPGLVLRPSNLKLLFWRGFFGGAAVVCYFTAIQHLGAGKGTLLNYTHSLFANLFAALFLGQRPPKAFWLYLLMALTGLWLLVDPSFDRFSWPEALGLLSGVFGGAAILCIKRLRDSDNAITIFSALTLGGLAFAFPAILVESSSFELWTLSPARLAPLGWMALLAMAMLSMCGQMAFTHGYKHVSVALGTVLSLITPFVAALAGWHFLNEEITLKIVLGGVLVITASVFTGLLEEKQKDPTK